MSNSLLDAAWAYAERGWFIYPAPKKGAAHVKWALGTDDAGAKLEDRRATTDPATIRRWWTKYPMALICLDCGRSGLAVVDLDVKKGLNGPAVLGDLELEHGLVPKTLTQRTPSGGIHLIYRGTIKTTVSVIGRDLVPSGSESGIDTRGRGGMIVLAPSAGYRMAKPDTPIADLPQWLAELAGVIRERVASGHGDFEPLYSDEEFAALLNLIPVQRYDANHDAWLELMLACSHSSTVANGKPAFMAWTTKDGPGNRIGYGSDEDLISARWDYNAARGDMVAGVKAATFNMHVTPYLPAGMVLKSAVSVADDFGHEPEPEPATWGDGYSEDAAGVVRFVLPDAAMPDLKPRERNAVRKWQTPYQQAKRAKAKLDALSNQLDKEAAGKM